MIPRRGIASLMLGAALALGVQAVVGTVGGESRGGGGAVAPGAGFGGVRRRAAGPAVGGDSPTSRFDSTGRPDRAFPGAHQSSRIRAPLRPQSRWRLSRRRRQPTGRGRTVAADSGRPKRGDRRPPTGGADPRRSRGDGAAARWDGGASCPGRRSSVGARGRPALVADGGTNARRRRAMSPGLGEGRCRGARGRARASVRGGDGTSARSPCAPDAE